MPLSQLLHDFVHISASALESEDKYLLESISTNPAGNPGTHGGILRIQNERYLQYVVLRALYSRFPYPVTDEEQSFDLVVKHPDRQGWLAVVEMKRWMSPSGCPEIDWILRDASKLLTCQGVDHRWIIVFSANPPAETTNSIGWLSSHLWKGNPGIMPEVIH